MVFRIRELLIRQRTQAINALRGHLTEFGQVVPQGAANAARLIAIVDDPDSDLVTVSLVIHGIVTLFPAPIAALLERKVAATTVISTVPVFQPLPEDQHRIVLEFDPAILREPAPIEDRHLGETSMHIHSDRPHAHPPCCRWGVRGLCDIYGYALAAQTG